MQGPVPAGRSMHRTIALLRPVALYRPDHVKQVLNKEINNKLIIIPLETTSPSCQLRKKNKSEMLLHVKSSSRIYFSKIHVGMPYN